MAEAHTSNTEQEQAHENHADLPIPDDDEVISCLTTHTFIYTR